MRVCSDDPKALADAIRDADAVLVGAGSGLSTSAGLTYDGERFRRLFHDFEEGYGITDMYSGGFHRFPDEESYWAWWSRCIWFNRYDARTDGTYRDLLDIVGDKDHFVITTNVDHQFVLNGFDPNRVFATQGDYGLFQCANACSDETYPNRQAVSEMVSRQEGMRIPSELVPRCPRCGGRIVPNLRCDDRFVQDREWYGSRDRYESFLRKHDGSRILLLELGVGPSTPGWIKYPFWRMTMSNPHATYASIGYRHAVCPESITDRSILIDGDISAVLRGMRGCTSDRSVRTDVEGGCVSLPIIDSDEIG